MRENEILKTELPSKSVADYKQSVGFKWGQQRMGQVSYEYEYRVALARFQARYPDLEVDSDPFTEKPEDSLVPIETRRPWSLATTYFVVVKPCDGFLVCEFPEMCLDAPFLQQLAFAVRLRGTLVPTCSRDPRGRLGGQRSSPAQRPSPSCCARPGPSDDQVKGGVDWMSVVLIELPPLTSGGLGYLYLRRDSSHGRHVIAVVLDTPPTAYSQGCWRLVGPSRSACHAAVRPLSGALQIGRPFALALSGRQPPDGGGAAGWSTRYVCSAMPSTLFRAVGRLVTDKNVNKVFNEILMFVCVLQFVYIPYTASSGPAQDKHTQKHSPYKRRGPCWSVWRTASTRNRLGETDIEIRERSRSKKREWPTLCARGTTRTSKRRRMRSAQRLGWLSSSNSSTLATKLGARPLSTQSGATWVELDEVSKPYEGSRHRRWNMERRHRAFLRQRSRA
ncbi:hypothetical protein BHE74_00022280 [Ensete ventricosum]|nr:hypothetical protein BHE74_00022280 [Ensete ventricosum]